MGTLIDFLPADRSPDAVLDGFLAWAGADGLALYPAQEEALLEAVSRDGVGGMHGGEFLRRGRTRKAQGVHVGARQRRAA